jgi:CubicO group peptidase (beta-lactamase class C family)
VGVRKLGSPARVSRSDWFHTGSDGKAMFATAAARLVERGVIRWDTTLGEVFPELIGSGGAAYRKVTLEDLFRHRSGLLALEDDESLSKVPQFAGSPASQRLQFTAWALRTPPVVKPRTKPLYSNTGYIVAAAMLERITRRSYEDLMQDLLFRPLRMDVSYEWPATGALNSQPWGHQQVEGRLVPRSPYWPEGRIPAWSHPASGVSLSTRDFARFVRLHLVGLRGGSTLLDRQSFVKLHTPVDGYGIGWAVMDVDGRRISAHLGGSGLFLAVMWIDAEAGRATVAMTNADTGLIEAGLVQVARILNSEDLAVTEVEP